MKVVSLASVNISIVNNAYKAATGRADISIGPGNANKQLGQVSYGFSGTNIFSMQTSADGGYAFSHNASKAGTISIEFNQTSPFIDTLCEYILWCRDNAQDAAATIVIKSSSGIIDCDAKDCFPQSYPDISVQETSQSRTFTFLCGELNPGEYAIKR